jgi:hypothetical protein
VHDQETTHPTTEDLAQLIQEQQRQIAALTARLNSRPPFSLRRSGRFGLSSAALCLARCLAAWRLRPFLAPLA